MKSRMSLSNRSRTVEARHSQARRFGLMGRFAVFAMLLGLLVTSFYIASSASSSPGALMQENSKGSSLRVGSSNGSSLLRSPSRMSGYASALPAPLPVLNQLDTFAADCSTPKSVFVVGDTVCVRASGFPLSAFFPRKLTWATTDSTIVRSTDIVQDPQTDLLPITPTSFVGGQVIDNRGTWQVAVRNPFFGFIEAIVRFTVTNPALPTADVGIDTTLSPNSVGSGSQIVFQLQVTNHGPDSSTNVQLTDAVPNDSTFGSFVQTSGPSFTCTGPAAGETGTTTCSIASLPSGAEAVFIATYNVNTGVAAGTVITNTADVASVAPPTPPTDDQNPRNNSTSASATVTSSGGGGACSLNCPDNITVIANTTEDGQRGAHVTFDPAEPSGTCGAITASPASGSFFPAGTSIVTVSSELNGGSCSFTITVEDQGTNPPTISCPANQTANADSNCSAPIDAGTATATGNNVTVIGDRSDGKPLYTCDANGTNCVRRSTDDPYTTGVTTITWKAYSHDTAGPYASADDEESHRTGVALCSQTITVNDVAPPTITPPPNQSASADANCMAPVPDFTTNTSVSDNCACASSDTSDGCQDRQRITVTQSPAPGTMVGLGPHDITLTANDGSSNNSGAGNSSTAHVTFTVNDTTAPVITCPADVLNVPSEPGTCAAHVTPGTATATDNCDSSPTITASRSDGRPITDTYPKGTTTITWTATDDAGNHSSCMQTVVVVDTQPPVIVFNGQTPSMWPPNHKYQTFQVTNFVTSVTDNCDSLSVSAVYITKVTSDELENSNGDGNTLNDIVIAANCKSVQLRSERDGGGNGRVYTIFFSVQDSSGNVGTGTATVVVRHNPGEPAVDSGPHYTVMSNCP